MLSDLNSDVLLVIIENCDYESIFPLCLTCKIISNVLCLKTGKKIVLTLQNRFRVKKSDQILERLDYLGDDLRNYVEQIIDSKDDPDTKSLFVDASNQFEFLTYEWVIETLQNLKEPSRLCKYIKRERPHLKHSTDSEVLDYVCDRLYDDLDVLISEIVEYDSDFDKQYWSKISEFEKIILLKSPKLMRCLWSKLEAISD